MGWKRKRHLFWYRPTSYRFTWQRYRMGSGGMFQMMRFYFFGVNYYGI